MTTIAALLGPADRERLLERLAELRELDREMRAPGSLAAPDSHPAGVVAPLRYPLGLFGVFGCGSVLPGRP